MDLRGNPGALLGRAAAMSESAIAARRAWVRSPHCAFRSYVDDNGRRCYGLVARTFGVDHLEFDSRITIAMREENLQPMSSAMRMALRQDAITTRAVMAMPGVGFAEFLEQMA
jgi:hypothetical protein